MPFKNSLYVHPAHGISAEISVPGDKSITHRALIIGSICRGASRIKGQNMGGDAISTSSCLRALGVKLESTALEAVVHGGGLDSFSAPGKELNAGNSGTTMRLMAGLLAGQRFDSVLTGDSSLSSRPMGRVADPLSGLGAKISLNDGKAPISITGTRLKGALVNTVVPSAQVKSALLLAGLYAEGETVVEEPSATRNHTELLLRHAGAGLRTEGLRTAVTGGSRLEAFEMSIPGDFSSAAFWILAGILLRGSHIVINDVSLNPGRTGFLDKLAAMGADVKKEILSSCPEPCGRIEVKFSQMRAVNVSRTEVPLMIDEIPLMMLAATQAEGTTVFDGVGELRVKETDRLAGTISFLRAIGASAEYHGDVVIVSGPSRLKGGSIDSGGDHRMAMLGACAGLVCRDGVYIHGADCASISYPEFWEKLSAFTAAV